MEIAKRLHPAFWTWLASGISLAVGLAGFLIYQNRNTPDHLNLDLDFYPVAFPLGLGSAVLILGIEQGMFRRMHPNWRGWLVTVARCAGYGVVSVALGFLAFNVIVAIVLPDPTPLMGAVAISALATYFLLPTLLPFGLISGTLTGIAVWLYHRDNAKVLDEMQDER